MNDSLLGSQIAGYRVERVLGRGGMASVYFAWDTRLDRPVALKVMDERYRDTPAYVDRFIHEAKTIASWDHPNIVHVLDAGEQGGVYYYAMEFIRGLDLAQLERQYLDARQLMPYQDVVRIGWSVANALDYAHAHGIIHRDVKPSNVLISVDGRVVLSDFGLVMDINRGTLGETFGSPAYIAPEQARNSAASVPQSDNYSLGVMLYEMLTGTTPFHDSSPMALALKHLTEEPPAPRAINPRLSPAVEAVLLRALRKQPNERYATGREMLSALEHALGDELNRPEAAVPMATTNATQVFITQRAQAANPPPPNPLTNQPQSGPQYVQRPRPAAPPPSPGSTQVRDYSYPQSPASTAVFPRSGSGAYPPPNQPRVYPAGAGPSYGAPNYGGPSYGGSYGAPPPAAPRRRRLGWGFGCLGALVLLLLLSVAASAAFRSVNPQGLTLPGGIGSIFGFPPAATQPAAATAAPTNTAVPPSATPQPTFTPIPPSATPVPPTATPVPPTVTLAPTFTPIPPTATATPGPVFNLTLYRQKTDGIILANRSKINMPLAGLEIWGQDSTPLVTGSAWNVDQLEPGQCVSVWVTDAKPTLPKGVKCEPTGKLLVSDTRFWNQTLNLRYNGAPVAVCQKNDTSCDFDTAPNP